MPDGAAIFETNEIESTHGESFREVGNYCRIGSHRPQGRYRLIFPATDSFVFVMIHGGGNEMATTSLLELIRTSSPEEQADALGELIRLRAARTKDPFPIPESISSKRLIGYFSPILTAAKPSICNYLYPFFLLPSAFCLAAARLAGRTYPLAYLKNQRGNAKAGSSR